MRNNANTFSHPKTLQKLRFALWLAKLEACKKAKAGQTLARGKQYVQNRKGNNYLRLDVEKEAGGYSVTVWGDCSRNVTGLVYQAAIKHAAKGR